MKMQKKILYIEGNVDGTVGGSYYVLFDLVNCLDKSIYKPIVGFYVDNYVNSMLNDIEIETVLFKNPKSFVFSNRILYTYLSPIRKFINLFKKLIIPSIFYAYYLKKNKIDLVNLNNSIVRNHPWMLASLLSRTKCITHEMGINYNYSRSARFFGKKLNAIICVSYAIRDNLYKYGIKYPNITVIQNSIDLKRYQRIQTPEDIYNIYNIDKKTPIIGVVGNVKEWKGQETIVRAAALLVDQFPKLKCFLVGDTSPDDIYYKNYLIELCKRLNIQDNVIFTGFKKNPLDYMQIMDIVVHTSIEPEPFGIVLLEAMALAKPLISTTIGGPKEIIINEETGILVEPGNPEKLFHAIKKCLDDTSYAQNMGRLGRQRLNEEFSLNKNVQKTMKLYDKILSK